MKQPDYRYLFGPVPSRRFGRSLGIDLTPHKTCSLDCVFCQLGRTPQKTLERKAYVPTADVIAEIDHWLQTDGHADYLTLSGSGEPTLHAEFGRVLAFLHDQPIPSVLLTNGTLKANEETILAMLKRRPCNIKHIQAAFGMHINEVSKYLGVLMKKEQIHADSKTQEVYYRSI